MTTASYDNKRDDDAERRLGPPWDRRAYQSCTPGREELRVLYSTCGRVGAGHGSSRAKVHFFWTSLDVDDRGQLTHPLPPERSGDELHCLRPNGRSVIARPQDREQSNTTHTHGLKQHLTHHRHAARECAIDAILVSC